ncbi:MAG: tRNA lysidine(34) synthetase TilS [Bacteroidia bacterium]|nr:tRNA lysidine(34) synthetase TilS [Bacteroidia bacterium]
MKIEFLPGKILAGWSAGPDSTAMVRLLLDAGCDLAVAHVNYRLRGRESDEDEWFVRDWAQKWNLALHVYHADLNRETQNRSLQEAARIVRYRFFRQLCQSYGYDCIALGHTADDDVETRLYALLRSKRFNPLSGIPSRRSRIVRPLMRFTRAQILDYLHSMQIPYRTDSSNLKSEYLRNKIRLEILPKFAEINPSFVEHILYAGSLTDAQTRMLRRLFTRCAILRNDFLDTTRLMRFERRYGPEFRRLFFLERLQTVYGMNVSEVETAMRLAEGQTGKSAVVRDLRLIRERDGIAFLRSEPEIPSPLKLADGQGRVNFGKVVIVYGPNPMYGRGFKADFERLRFPLTVRVVRRGDVIVPLGMQGRKRVLDVLAEMKVPAAKKRNSFVVEDQEGIVYVQDYRPAERVKITETTRSVFYFTFTEST